MTKTDGFRTHTPRTRQAGELTVPAIKVDPTMEKFAAALATLSVQVALLEKLADETQEAKRVGQVRSAILTKLSELRGAERQLKLILS